MQRALAATGLRGRKIPDLLIAAAAERPIRDGAVPVDSLASSLVGPHQPDGLGALMPSTAGSEVGSSWLRTWMSVWQTRRDDLGEHFVGHKWVSRSSSVS